MVVRLVALLLFCTVLFCLSFFVVVSVIWAMLPDANKWMDGNGWMDGWNNVVDFVVTYEETSTTALSADPAVAVPLMTINGWILMQRKVMQGSETFNHVWTEYREGFGTTAGNDNYWLGLDKVYRLVQMGSARLRVEVENISDVIFEAGEKRQDCIEMTDAIPCDSVSSHSEEISMKLPTNNVHHVIILSAPSVSNFSIITLSFRS